MVDTNILTERAELLLDQGRHRDAEANIRQVLQQEPDNDYALALLSRCFYADKKFNEGIEVLQQAIALSPYTSFYFYLLAFGHYQLNQQQQAIGYLQTAIHINPYNAEYFGLLAYIYIDEKKFEPALQTANEGLAVDAENITCLNAISVALNKLNRTDAAIETMHNALAQDPDNEMTHSTVGWNFLEKGRHKEAEKHFLEALRINPNYSSARNGLKEAMKSKVLPYKWLLQYSFWLQNKGKKVARFLPFALYIVFRLLVSAFDSNNTTASLSWILIGLYLLLVVTSWTINSIANFILLFNTKGKYALTHTEKWSAISVVSSLGAGLAIIALSFTDVFKDTAYFGTSFFAGLILITLALPLGELQFPLSLKSKGWKGKFSLLLSGLGLLSLLVFAALPNVAMLLFAAYGFAFIIYNWSGLVR